MKSKSGVDLPFVPIRRRRSAAEDTENVVEDSDPKVIAS